jgi:hypothetical protein
MEYIALSANQSELATRVAQAALWKKRIVLFNIDERLWLHLAYAGFLETLDYINVSTDTNRIGSQYNSHNGFHSALRSAHDIAQFKPDWILLCADDAGLDDFYYIKNNFGYTPKEIFLPTMKWDDRLYDVAATVAAFVKKVPETVWGGTNYEAHICIYEALKYIAENKIPGDIVNLGVFRGWSMYLTGLIRDHFGLKDRKIIGFDTFDSFVPSDDKRDIYLETNNRPFSMYADVPIKDVVKNLLNIAHTELVKGDLQETAAQLSGGQYCLVFVDVDDYSPTKAAWRTWMIA